MIMQTSVSLAADWITTVTASSPDTLHQDFQ